MEKYQEQAGGWDCRQLIVRNDAGRQRNAWSQGGQKALIVIGGNYTIQPIANIIIPAPLRIPHNFRFQDRFRQFPASCPMRDH